MNLTKPQRIEDADYRAFIRTEPCIFCPGYNPNTECCHADESGTGTKGSDRRTFPGCRTHHIEFDRNREKFLAKYSWIDLEDVMKKLNEKYEKLTGEE